MRQHKPIPLCNTLRIAEDGSLVCEHNPNVVNDGRSVIDLSPETLKMIAKWQAEKSKGEQHE